MSSHSNRPIRIGLIGAGIRLRDICKRLLAEDSRLQIGVVFDPDPVSVEHARKELGGVWRQAESAEAVCADATIDWVMIGSWNCHHAAHAIEALKADKHVFCEKPLATTLEDCLRVRDAVRRTSRHFVFGLVLRYSPHYQFLRSLLSRGEVGRLTSFEFNETLTARHGAYINGNWRRRSQNAGSHILEKCCHDLDLANWMVDSLPTRVASFGGRSIFVPDNAVLHQQLAEDGVSPFSTWTDHLSLDPFTAGGDILDHQVIILEYANGVRATFHTSTASALPERRFYLLGTHGSIRADAYDGSVTWARIGQESLTQRFQSSRSNGHAGGDERMVKCLAATMLEGTAALAGIDEAIRSAVVAFSIDQAQASGEVVSLEATWAKVLSSPT